MSKTKKKNIENKKKRTRKNCENGGKQKEVERNNERR